MKMNIKQTPACVIWVEGSEHPIVRLETETLGEDFVRVWWLDAGTAADGESLQFTAMRPEQSRPLEAEFLKTTTKRKCDDE